MPEDTIAKNAPFNLARLLLEAAYLNRPTLSADQAERDLAALSNKGVPQFNGEYNLSDVRAALESMLASVNSAVERIKRANKELRGQLGEIPSYRKDIASPVSNTIPSEVREAYEKALGYIPDNSLFVHEGEIAKGIYYNSNEWRRLKDLQKSLETAIGNINVIDRFWADVAHPIPEDAIKSLDWTTGNRGHYGDDPEVRIKLQYHKDNPSQSSLAQQITNAKLELAAITPPGR